MKVSAKLRRSIPCLVLLLVCAVLLSYPLVSGAGDELAPSAKPASYAAFEVVPQQHTPASPKFDANCLLLNPQWGWQIEHGDKSGYEAFPNSMDVNLCNELF